MTVRANAARSPAASSQAIHDALLTAIIRHRLGPGAKLVEDEICEIFGVGRTVVRAALQALARDGVVILQRNKGASVAQPTPGEAREIFEARALIEPHMAALAARAFAEQGNGLLVRCVEAEHDAMRRDDPREAVFQSAEFHRLIAEMSGQTVLAAILRDLLVRSSLVISLYWTQPEALCDNHAHHAILDALAGRDEAGVSALMRRHIDALLAGLDLSERPSRPSDLAQALDLARRG